MDAWIDALLQLLSLAAIRPQHRFPDRIRLVHAAAARLRAAVFGLVKLNPDLFWPAMGVATAGATLGGAVTYWMGYGAERAYEHVTHKHRDGRALRMLRRHGAKACLLSWLPVVGDPLCAVAGWLQLPFWPCVIYMTIGKFGRYS
jgi:membrane protein YqaA with SNARE-associated domain